MQIKLFGKMLFKSKKKDLLQSLAQNHLRESKFLPDFYTNTEGNSGLITLSDFVRSEPVAIVPAGTQIKVPTPKGKKTKIATKAPIEVPKITPKGVYNLKTLNDTTFELKTDTDYVNSQIEEFTDKLNLIKSEEYDMRHGVIEIASILTRMENRKKYPTAKAFFEDYPYTTTTKINAVIKDHQHLKLGQVAQFVADMPKEAVDTMKQYNKHTQSLCGKQAVFYIIADKKDFQKSDTRRDPILLAQSPFGHFWQILGAWDDEMRFLEEL